MKFLKLFALLIVIVISNNISAQKMMTFSADDAVILNETMAILLVKEGALVVEMMPPTDKLGKDYKDLDLKKGDKVLFLNGKKIKSAEDFRKRYDELKAGDELKLGIRRGEERFILNFPKADPSKQKGIKMMRVSPGQDPEEVKKQLEKENK